MAKRSFTQNRELSWLRFNERVLAEAEDIGVPLFERLKFISIFTSNLDEFFMIRVGSLCDLVTINDKIVDNKSGMTPKEQLEKIYSAVGPLYEKREQIYSSVEKQLRFYGIYSLSMKELEPNEHKFISKYYKTNIEPILSPQIVDSHHPFPFIPNKVVYVGALLKHKNTELFGFIPVPPTLPDIIFLPGNELRFISTEKVIREYISDIFNMYDVLEKTNFCITRNADINPDDETDINGDFRKKMKKLLAQRRRLGVVRMEISNSISHSFEQYLCNRFAITKKQIYVTKPPFKLNYVYQLEDKLLPSIKKIITYTEFKPQYPSFINTNESIIDQVFRKDMLLSYPYESMQPFLNLVKEAAYDQSVISIKITIYRLAGKARLVDYLCAAAENGKDVTVLIELRARFDEQNNIDWSERLEDAGCRLIYGIEDYKVHSKICLITRRCGESIKYITQVGTGNYNEKTAKIYTDLSLITANEEIGIDANEFFKNMAISNLEGRYNHLLVAPNSFKSKIIDLIDNEIKKRKNGSITVKINSITDMVIMKKLREASCAGVNVNLIVRGICCIVPQIPDKTENITVRSIVGRYLEHSRIFCFGTGEEEKIYISSADFMTRNTERRVEIACPIYDNDARAKIHHILDIIMKDNVKARLLCSDGEYTSIPNDKEHISSQDVLMDNALNNSININRESNIISIVKS